MKAPSKSGPGLHSVVLSRKAGDISLVRPQTITAELKVGGQPERRIALPRRGLRDCLSEELRRLDADDVYAEVLTKGMALVAKYAESKAAAGAKGATRTPSAKSGKAAPADAPDGTQETPTAGSDAASRTASPGADATGRSRTRRATRSSSGGAGTGPTRRRSAARKSGSS